MITSRPYNTRAQGTVECFHRELRKNIHYDIVNLKSKGVSWDEYLPNYMIVLNDLAREELGWRSPFEIYYGRISNFIKKDNIEEDGIIHQQDIDLRLLDSSTISKTLEHTEIIRHNAAKFGKKMDQRMVKKHKRKYKNDVFAMNKVVFWSG